MRANYVLVDFESLQPETAWANVCVHCGMLQGAFFLHSEPDGPFFGGPEGFAGARVVVAELGFDADGASYSI